MGGAFAAYFFSVQCFGNDFIMKHRKVIAVLIAISTEVKQEFCRLIRGFFIKQEGRARYFLLYYKLSTSFFHIVDRFYHGGDKAG